MPSLSERDLGHVEKLFNAVSSVLDYDHAHRTYDTATTSAGPATSNANFVPVPSPNATDALPAPQQQPSSKSRRAQFSLPPTVVGSGRNAASSPDSSSATLASTVTPSEVLREHQDQLTEQSRGRFTTSSTGAVSGYVSKRRLWAELAFLIWRVVGLQKLSLMAFVTSNPDEMLIALARALLSFLKESCATFAGLGKAMRMRQVGLLAQERLLFLLRVFCNLKNCTVMLSEISGASSAADAQVVFDAICAVVVAGQHFSWMSQIYVWFCDEAARFSAAGAAIPSAYVYATHDALQCVLGCCTNQAACARAFLYAEPVACVTYMFYGLKLRISTCDVLRPYEDDRVLKETLPAVTAAASSLSAEPPSAIQREPATSSVGNSRSALPRHLNSFAASESDANAQLCNSPIPLRPPGARYLNTRYFGLLTLGPASAPVSPGLQQQQQQQQREGPIVVNCSAVASLVRPSPSPSLSSQKVNLSTSWAFDTPGLTREQLKQLLLGGRENAFDALLFAALDVVVEVLRVTRDYGHWMVLSMVSNLLLLSRKNIDVSDVASPTTTSAAAAALPAPLPLSHVVAMYENITVMFVFLFSLMQGLDDDDDDGRPLRRSDGHGSANAEKPASGAAGSTGVEDNVADKAVFVKGEKSRGGSTGPSGTHGGGKDNTPLPPSSSLHQPSALASAARVGLSAGSISSTPAPERFTAAATTSPHDTPQLREDLSQHLVHMVLQTDVHAVVVATTRVLQCDRTLFRVLHQFCVLDGRTMEQPKLPLLPPPPPPASKTSDSNSVHIGTGSGRHRRHNASQGHTANDTTSMSLSSAGGGVNASRALTGGSLPFASLGSPYSGSAATLTPYLSSGRGAGGRRVGALDGTYDSSAPVFNAAASFFTTANFGDLRQVVNAIGVGGSETPNDGGLPSGGLSGDFSGSHGSLQGTRGSGVGNSSGTANTSQRRSSNAQKLQKQRVRNRSQGTDKKSGGSGENFAKSFFKSFFGSGKKGGGLFTRSITNDVDEGVEPNSDDEGSLDGDSSSAGSSSSSSASGDSDADNGSDKSNVLGNAAEVAGGADPQLSTMRSFGAASSGSALRRSSVTSGGSRRPPLSPFTQHTRRSHRHHRNRSRARPHDSPWRDVPSFIALISELVRIFNLILADTELSIDVRLGAGLLLPSIVLRDTQVFRLYEGRVLIRNYLSLLLHELQHNIQLRSVDDGNDTTTAQQPQTSTGEVLSQEKRSGEGPVQDPATPAIIGSSSGGGGGNVVSGRAHLTQRELITLVSRVMEALEQTFKVLGATPLTSDVASLTELPLYFFCADGKTPFGNALERSFTRVVVLWLIGLVGAQCDEDIDKNAMEVLLRLMSRAVTRGSLPRDSGTTLMLNAAGTATVVQISSVSGAAVPDMPGTSTWDWTESHRVLLDDADVAAASDAGAKGDGGSGLSAHAESAITGPLSASSGPVATSLASGRTGHVAGAAAASLSLLPDDGNGDVGGLYRGNVNNSLFDKTEFVGLAAAAGTDRAVAECGNTVEALGSVFRVLLGRSPELLTPAGLSTVLALFASHDSNVSWLGRECMMRSLETPSSYLLYADVIRDSDSFALTQTLSVISAYLSSSALSPVARHERRVWMQRSGCVDAAVRVLVRVLDSPYSTPTFMKTIPHLFQLLSAFESVEHTAPQLSGTNFVAAVTERLERLEGTEYFIIITQAVLDSCMGTYGGVDGSYTNAGGPGAHYAEMQVVGSFHIAQHNCAAEKPVFLELLPSLLRFAERHNAQLYSELVEVLFRVLECTGNVRSDRLADLVLDHGLSQMLPYLELSGAYVEERLPFTGSAAELHRFWQPVLLRAPRRSELRFTSFGGVQISVGTWPDTGFTIGAWFKFDRLYSTIPLFEFQGVISDGGGGGASTAPRGSPNLTALLFIFGGDSVQLTLNDARRSTVNEHQALQNFVPNKWMHVCAVLRTTQVLDVYMSGFKVGTTAFPAFASGTDVRVNVGCTDALAQHPYGGGGGGGGGGGASANAASLFSMGDVTLWAQALNRSQVEAELASTDCRGIGSSRLVVPAKILEESIPQELTLVRHMSNASVGAAVGSPGQVGGNFAGFAALINPKSAAAGVGGGGGGVSNASIGSAGHDPRNVLGLSFSAMASGGSGGAASNNNAEYDEAMNSGDGGSWRSSAQSRLPISTRMARFVPYENDDNLLRNVLSNTASYPVVAKLVGRYATPPKTWVDYPLLWATRGGVTRLLDWLHLVTSSAQLEGLLQLITVCFLRTTLAVTLDARTYMLFAYMLTHHVAAFFTNAACDQLLTLASSQINVFDEEHRIIVNRLAFEHILGNVAFYAAIPLDAALYLLQRVHRLFHPSQCRYARHNARFVIPYRFVDRLLHSLVDVAAQTPLPLRSAVVQVAQQVFVACDMEEGLVQIFVSLVALLTPDVATVVSRFNPHVKATLPVLTAMTHGKNSLPLRTANYLTTLLLSSLVECTAQGAFLTALARTVDLPWYASCLSRFADPTSVVLATRIFFEAVEHNPILQEEAMQHQSAIIEALTVHAAHDDLVLLLLAQSVGAARHVDVLSRKHSLQQQLDSVMTTFHVHPNSLVAPIFVKIFVVHLYRTVQAPRRQATRSTAVRLGERRLSYRVRRYFSLARICSRIMILLRVKRYRALLLPPMLVSTSSTPVLGPTNLPRHQRTRSAGMLSGISSNMSFAQSAATGPITTTTPGNLSFATSALVSGAGTGGVSAQHLPSFAVSPLGLQDAMALNSSGDGGGPLRGLSPPMTSLAARGSSGRGEDDHHYHDDDELQASRSVLSSHSDMKLVMPPPMSGGFGGDSSNSRDDDGVGGAMQQWKPPVLLPDMWSVPAPLTTSTTIAVPAPAASPPTTPRTSSLSHRLLTDATEGAARGSGNASRMTPPISLGTSPTSANAAVRRVRVSDGKQTDDDVSASEDSGDDDNVAEEKAERKMSSQFYVHSHTHKRAFAVLRVCVLLWLPIEVRRSRWVITTANSTHTLSSEEDYATRHATTLFCIRMFRHFASFSANFYLFVSSPLQVGALSALAAYITRDMLVEEADTWNTVIHTMTSAPMRQSGTASGPSMAVDKPTTYESAAATASTTMTSHATGEASSLPQQEPGVTPIDDRTVQQQQQQQQQQGGEKAKNERPAEAADDSAPSTSPTPVLAPTVAFQASSPNIETIHNNGDKSENAGDGSGALTEARRRRRGSGAAAATPLTVSAPTQSAQSPTSATQRMPRISSMTFRTAESSSAQLDQMTVLESPESSVRFVYDLEDDVDEDGVASNTATASPLQRRGGTVPVVGGESVNDVDVNSVPNTSFDAEGPPSINVTRVPPRRLMMQQKFMRQQQQQQTSSSLPLSSSAPPTATADSVPSFLNETRRQDALQETAKPSTAAASLGATHPDPGSPLGSPDGALDTSRREYAKTKEVNNKEEEDGDDDDDDSSSVSSADSATSQTSAASTNSAPITSSTVLASTFSTTTEVAPSSAPTTTAAAGKKAVNAPVPSFSNLPDAPNALLTCDPVDAYPGNIAKVAACAGEVVQRDAVSILQALIRASLDTLPVPHWIGGPTYGSCGGLLFQLLLIVSAKAATDDATTTLVQYFLLSVGNAVKEQRDRELALPPRQDATTTAGSPLGPHCPLSATPMFPGLGDASFGHGAMAASPPPPPPPSRGLSGSTDSAMHSSSLAMGGGGLFGTTNASFTSSAMLPPLSPNVGGAAAVSNPLHTSITNNDNNSNITASASLAGTPMPLAPTQQPFFSPNSVPAAAAASSPAGPRHTVQFVQPPLSQRAGGSGVTHVPHPHAISASSSPSTGNFSDVFLFNVNHFTDLIVDMLAINVLDLPMATHYFLTLLLLCQEWPSRYIDQLSWQVMRACIAVLNRPSMQDASVGLIESIYTLTTLVLRRGWKHKGVLECLLRVLYRVYGALPPAWMSDEDAKHRKRLITLIFRHMVQTYADTKELEKALTVRTLTQRLSLYDDFVMIFSLPSEEESMATFEQYCVAQSSSMETLMSGRLKAKADLAFKASIKTRSEYIKRIKAFNNQYAQVTEVADRYRKAALKNSYASRFSSYVATTPVLDDSQLHWLLSLTCALDGDHRAAACGSHPEAASGIVVSDDTKDGNNNASSAPPHESQLEQMRNCGDVTLYHFLDTELNYGEFKGVFWGTGRAAHHHRSNNSFLATSHLVSAPATARASSATSGGQYSSPNASTAPSSFARTRLLSSVRGASVNGEDPAAAVAETQPAADDDAEPQQQQHQSQKNDLVRAAQCEEEVQHIAVLLPPFTTRCRPHIGNEAVPISLKDLSITLTPSALTLLRYLLAPNEILRFISNGFRINGIHATPCLILLTSTTLKVIGFSRVTEGGDIILCEYDDDEDDPLSRAGNSNAASAASPSAETTAAPIKAARKYMFSMSSMTKQFQKFFTGNSTKRRQQQDGTRVAQAVRQVMGRNYQNIFWSYLVSSIRTVRSLRYMHLDTAVQLQLYYDEGPMLSVVDARQSMNPSARKEFMKVLKDVVAPQQCTFVDETQRAASMKANLVRWATGAMSNYDYLRFLNEVAGRTSRDLNQYPVFPWVLADYASATLDLESAATFRNFGYPMGAQTESRRGIVAQLFENTREVCDVETGKSYPFHHGTHYSTSGGVLYFLLRVQPFTTYARLFQGGDFDLAMRLFDSVAASFSSCVTGPADCKELIPEFYVTNNFLANADHLPLGVKSDGEPVDDVRLPPWAKNSRQVFTAVMRYALESFYVIEHLHQWIDLVFGVRRRGPLAMERFNVFQRMTYGEEVAQALQEAGTPHECDVIIAEVENFGQTPPQLFQERHPSHQELVPVLQGRATDGGSAGHGTRNDSGGGGGGGGGGSSNNLNSGSGNSSGGGAGGRSGAPNAANVSAITLGGLYTSAHSASSASGAGTQIGSTFSNLLSSGTFASGQTYTQAFRREAPKVVRILIHAMDAPQTWFVLRDPPINILQHPPPPSLVENFRQSRPAVLRFSPLHTSKKLACAYAQLVPVPDTDYYLCWHEHEARLMRYTAGQAVFHSMIAFKPPDESGARISAVAVGTRESVLLIAISTGAVYCLFPDDILSGALYLRVTMCYHRYAVEKIVLDPARHRAITVTRGHHDDAPIVWRVQRSSCNFLCRLSLEQLLPIPTEAELTAAGQTAEDAKDARGAVDMAVDSVTGHIAVATARALVIFDNNGAPFGVGTLPSPNSVRAVDSVTLEDDNGDVGVVVGRAVVVMPNLTAVSFYQTSEWAAGMSVLITGHTDGSLSVWRCLRLPPDTVEPGKIAMVEFHARLFSGAAATVPLSASATVAAGASSAAGGAAAVGGAAGGSRGQDGGASLSRSPAPLAAGGTDRPTATANSSSSPSTAALASTMSSAGCVGTGTGATNCPVTCLQQERADVPTFLVGYANGSTRQLVFEDPALTAEAGTAAAAVRTDANVCSAKKAL